ncbi:MAG: hypothetical protein VB139_08980 [Coriobacteriia bacterium]|nr:hypothetical protein [Coriobacteriia bacterium]
MTTREQADELLEMGKRRAGLKELHGLADEHRDRPAYHAPIDTADLLIHLAYEIRFNRKTGMSYSGKHAAEAAALMAEAKALLASTGERADHPTWTRWYGVARRFALTDDDRPGAAMIAGEQIAAIVALGDVDPETIEHLRDLKQRDESPRTVYS